MVDGDAHADDVRADERQAAAYGATGVPFFVVERRYAVAGAQPADVLLQVLERAWAERRPAVLVGTAAGEPEAGCAGESCAV